MPSELISTTQKLDPSTRTHLLASAIKLFAEQGFEATTIRSICKVAKVNVSLISYYFDGKEGLYREIFRMLQDERLASTSSLLNNTTVTSAESFRLKLSLFLESMIEGMAQHPSVFQLIHREMMEGFPRVKDLTRQHFSQMNDIVMNFLIQGKKQGYLKENLNLKVVAMVMMNVVMGFAAKHVLCQEIMELDFFNKEHRTLMLHDSLTVFFEGILRS